MIHDSLCSYTAVGSPVLDGVWGDVMTPRATSQHARIRFEYGARQHHCHRIIRDQCPKARFSARRLGVDDFAAGNRRYSARAGRGTPVIQGGPLEVSTEPSIELLDFVTAVRDRRSPTVPARPASALALASRVAEAMRTVAGLA